MQLDWSKAISAGVGPIIVISACGLLCLALYNRLAAIVARLRMFHRERLQQFAALLKDNDLADRAQREEIIAMLERQTFSVMRRAKVVRASLQALLGTVASLALCSMALGLSIAAPRLVAVAAILFVLGLTLLLIGVGLASYELTLALNPLEFESQFVSGMEEGMNHATRENNH